MRMLKCIAAIAAAAMVPACTSDDVMRIDGVTPGAGNAIAANTAMQMVDPWPYGVQDTSLHVPADRGSANTGAAAAADGGSSPIAGN